MEALAGSVDPLRLMKSSAKASSDEAPSKNHPSKFVLKAHRCTRCLFIGRPCCFGPNGISGRARCFYVVPCGLLGSDDIEPSPHPSWLNEIIRISHLTNRVHPDQNRHRVNYYTDPSFRSFFFSSINQFQARKQRWHEIWQLILWFEVQMAFFH